MLVEDWQANERSHCRRYQHVLLVAITIVCIYNRGAETCSKVQLPKHPGITSIVLVMYEFSLSTMLIKDKRRLDRRPATAVALLVLVSALDWLVEDYIGLCHC